MHRVLELCWPVRLAAVDRDIDLRDRSATGPCQPRDLVEPAARQTLSSGRPSNDRLRPEREAEAERLAVRSRVRVVAGLVPRHRRTIDDGNTAQPLHRANGFP